RRGRGDHEAGVVRGGGVIAAGADRGHDDIGAGVAGGPGQRVGEGRVAGQIVCERRRTEVGAAHARNRTQGGERRAGEDAAGVGDADGRRGGTDRDAGLVGDGGVVAAGAERGHDDRGADVAGGAGQAVGEGRDAAPV